MIKTTISIEPEIMESFRLIASEQKRNQTELIREALRIYIQRLSRPKPKGIGCYHSGRSDVSEKAEELIRQSVRETKNVVNR